MGSLLGSEACVFAECVLRLELDRGLCWGKGRHGTVMWVGLVCGLRRAYEGTVMCGVQEGRFVELALITAPTVSLCRCAPSRV